MTAPYADGSCHPSSWPFEEALTGHSGQLDEWITVLEYVQADSRLPFLVTQVEDLIGALREWHPSALWNPDRYAIQLLIPAKDPFQALQWAFDYHREAARIAGLTAATLVRVEILTAEEFELSADDHDGTGTRIVAPPAPRGLVCQELYTATRGLHTATTPAEFTDIVFTFVTAIGGQVELGKPRHVPGMIAIDVTMEQSQLWHARADAFSVAGLILEQSLPTLLADARQALSRR